MEAAFYMSQRLATNRKHFQGFSTTRRNSVRHDCDMLVISGPNRPAVARRKRMLDVETGLTLARNRLILPATNL